jgi:hypothetical protein
MLDRRDRLRILALLQHSHVAADVGQAEQVAISRPDTPAKPNVVSMLLPSSMAHILAPP